MSKSGRFSAIIFSICLFDIVSHLLLEYVFIPSQYSSVPHCISYFLCFGISLGLCSNSLILSLCLSYLLFSFKSESLLFSKVLFDLFSNTFKNKSLVLCSCLPAYLWCFQMHSTYFFIFHNSNIPCIASFILKSVDFFRPSQ